MTFDFELDRTSLLVSCSVDVSIATLEKRLHREGLTLGYRPAKARGLTLRRALARRVSNRDALLYGEVDDLCVSIQAIRKGETIVTRNVPRAATGPDFKKLLAASDGRHAKLVKAVLKVHALPEARRTFRLSWKDKKGRDAFLRAFWSSGIRPARFAAFARTANVTLAATKEMVAAEERCLRKLCHETNGRIQK